MTCTRPFLRSIKSAFASNNDTMLVQVSCGKCPQCLKAKQRELAVRLQYDLQSPICYDHCFFTLTYSPENLEYNVVDYDTGEIFYKMPSVNKETVQKYLKRVRKALDYDPEKTKLYYYITGEYGAKKNPHYHGIIYLLGEKTSKIPLAEVLKKNGSYVTGMNYHYPNVFNPHFQKLLICTLQNIKSNDVKEQSFRLLFSNCDQKELDLASLNITPRKLNSQKKTVIYIRTDYPPQKSPYPVFTLQSSDCSVTTIIY